MTHYLVIQLARFGDLVQTKRLLSTLNARSNSTVHLCVDNSLESLARIIYPNVEIHAIAAHGTGLKGMETIQAMLIGNRGVFANLQAIQFESVFNLNFSPLNFRIAALFDPEIVEGYSWKNGQELIGVWPSMAMRWSNFRRIGINLVDFWAGYCPDMIAPDLVNPEAYPKGGGIGIVLAGRESRRSLPADLLAQIASTLGAVGKAEKIYLLGGASEYSAGEAVLRGLPGALADKAENMAGKTDWGQLVEIVDSLDMLLTPDTGTMHLAAHLGTPVRAFFLSSAWCFETGPYGKGHIIYQALTECLPCLETQPCPFDVKCRNCFEDPIFQRFLATNKEEHAPQGVIGFHSSFDALGQVYSPFAGHDSDEEQRSKFRQFIMQFLTSKGGGVSDVEHMLAERIYKEMDWMTDLQPDATFR